MATFFEPPALLSIAVVLGSAAGAMYYGLRTALRAPLPVVTDEKDEVWGTEDPPPPPKKPYTYPADRTVEAASRSERGEEPVTTWSIEPQPMYGDQPISSGARDYSGAGRDDGEAPVEDFDDDLEEEEISLADLFRPKRRDTPPPTQEAPDAPTED